MITHNVKQGTPEWHALRASHFCASDAPAMMGFSKTKSRTALLLQKKTGIADDISPATQALFDRGHASEAGARPIAEVQVGEDLFPCTGSLEVEGLPMLSSFDGLTGDDSINFEHKLFNEKLAEFICTTNDLPDTHWPQVEQQMLVSGASKTLFVTSDGTEDSRAWIWYESKPERRSALIASTHQFAADLAEFVPQAAAPQIVAAPVESLPAVFVQVTGSLAVTDNLKKFEVALQDFVAKINRSPETDQDFADCESAIKTLTKAEEALDAAESAALAQVECIDTMRMLKATLKDLARSNRLSLEKLVKAEKENRRMQMVMDASRALASHVFELKCEFFTNQAADFAGVIKGLKSLDSMKDKIATELANAKIKANESVGRINANLDIIATLGDGFGFLFADKATLVQKAPDDLSAVIANRIAAHKAEALEKEEALRAKIRAEEQAKAEREAAAKLAAEQAEAARLQREKDIAEKAAQPAPVQTEQPAQVAQPATLQQVLTAVLPAPLSAALAPNSTPTLSLGSIGKRLGFNVSRDFLASLGFEGTKDRAAYLYHDAQFRDICNAIARHALAVADQQPEGGA